MPPHHTVFLTASENQISARVDSWVLLDVISIIDVAVLAVSFCLNHVPSPANLMRGLPVGFKMVKFPGDLEFSPPLRGSSHE